MIGLLQRVSSASVAVDGAVIAAIGRGLLVLVGVEAGDGEAQAERLVERLLGYRVFPDEEGRMNRSLRQVRGCLLLVPQFILFFLFLGHEHFLLIPSRQCLHRGRDKEHSTHLRMHRRASETNLDGKELETPLVHMAVSHGAAMLMPPLCMG